MSRSGTAVIAAVCGAVAGCLYLAVLLGTPGALILVYMTQLPLFVAGLWFGAGAAGLAGLSGALVLLVASDLFGAAVFAALNAVPVTVLVRQALLARQGEDGRLVWYPLGLLAAWLTVLALGGIGAALVLLGGADGLQAALQDVVATVIDRLSRRSMPNRDLIAATVAMIIPGTVAASWMIMTVINAALAQGVLARFGANWRPTPRIAELGLPLWVPGLLAIAATATLFEGTLRYLGLNTMIALCVAFGLAGLAVLHAAAWRMSHPVMALTGFYMLAALFGWPFLGVAVLGLLESWLGLRRRLGSQGAGNDG